MNMRRPILCAALLALPAAALAETTLVMPQQDEARTLSPAPSSDTDASEPLTSVTSSVSLSRR